MARTPTQTPQEEQPGGPSREDEVLMREIDEAVRQDDAKAFFEKYGLPLGGAVAVLLIALFGYWWWDNSTEAKLEAQSETIISALDSVDAGDFDSADEKVAGLIDDGSIGARTMARFLQASNALEQGESARAVELFAAIAADGEAPQPLRDLATIREISADFDEREPADVIARLESMAVPGHAFFGSAGELTAIAHLEAGDRSKAGTMFGEIAKDDELPETLRARARQMAGLLGVDAIVDVEELIEEGGSLPAAPQGARGARGARGAQGRPAGAPAAAPAP